MNIVLVGPRGSGKSTVARLLAERLGWRVLSTDAECEKRLGVTIAAYVAANGWDAFRAAEREVVASLRALDQTVVDTGGGAVLAQENRAVLRSLGPVVYLTAPAAVLAARISGDANRPSLTGKSPTEEMAEVLRTRDPIYRETAGEVVDTLALSAAKAAERLAKLIR